MYLCTPLTQCYIQHLDLIMTNYESLGGKALYVKLSSSERQLVRESFLSVDPRYQDVLDQTPAKEQVRFAAEHLEVLVESIATDEAYAHEDRQHNAYRKIRKRIVKAGTALYGRTYSRIVLGGIIKRVAALKRVLDIASGTGASTPIRWWDFRDDPA